MKTDLLIFETTTYNPNMLKKQKTTPSTPATLAF